MRPLDATEVLLGSGSRPPVAFDLGGVLLRGGVLEHPFRRLRQEPDEALRCVMAFPGYSPR